ncbi:MAG: radical SAM protein [Phycisphaerales bacterium]|nr:radical SAM protein [Phycisphaerales bacterium]
MNLTTHIRRWARKRLTGEADLVLEHRLPQIDRGLNNVDELGLYLHLPFCRQICPYCPYNKTLYRPELAERYRRAVLTEIDLYADVVGDRPVSSFYIGGGTPTTMLSHGLGTILKHIHDTFNMRCSIHMESHPNDLTDDALSMLVDLGVEHLSIGVEALQDHHLRALRRPYTVEQVTETLQRAVARPFRCVNADMMFALPGQTVSEVAQTGSMLVDLGVDQIAAYPVFTFPHTTWGQTNGSATPGHLEVLRRRRMLSSLESLLYNTGFRRTSVWAFTRDQVPAYCSVTVPLYLGLGASGGSYLRDVFYLNTFSVPAYIRSLERGQLPIALTVELSEKMQMAGWLYWRLYETHFRKSAFPERFGVPFDHEYGRLMRVLSALGLARVDDERVELTDTGAYWLHVFQDFFSIDGVGRIWAEAMDTPWPRQAVL